jgi:hypothetical protein
MSTIPEYNLKSKLGVSYLQRKWNDIEVFVEDKKCSNMWINIINKVLKNIAIIQTVCQLGNKHEVIKMCNEDNDFSYPKIYIIDGDFDFIFNHSIKNKRLFQLDVYCIENLLFSEKAILEIIFRLKSNSNMPKKELKNDLNFISICKHIKENWSEWYILVLLLKYYNIRNISIESIPNSTRFIIRGRNKIFFNKKKIKDFLDNLKEKILKEICNSDFKKKFDTIHSILIKKKIDILQVISGKECLIPFIFHILREKYSYRGNLDPLKVELARYTEFDLKKDFYDSFKQKCLVIINECN